MGLSEVSSILWQERQLLDLLLFKLEEEQLVLSSGRSRWLTHVTREVEMVLQEIKRSEITRAIEVDAAAAELGLAAGPSLRQLSEAASSPWKGILEQHRRAFLALSQEILAPNPTDTNNLTQVDLGHLDSAVNNIQNTLADVGARYSRLDTIKTQNDFRMDDLESSLSGVEDIDLPKMIQPSLVDFLR